MRIKKTITPKHEATLSPFIREFVSSAASITIPNLQEYLATFPRGWPFPRGDLYHWIPLLNRFDEILEDFIKKYKLKDGPQTTPWELFDERLVCTILEFSRLLVENCGNRSIYASSGHINDLLNTTSLDVLEQCLRLGCRLAQRYYTSRIRGAMNTSSHAALLASHYSINLEKVFKLGSPFTRTITVGGSGKSGNKYVAPIPLNDFESLASEGSQPPESFVGEPSSKPKKAGNAWDEWGGVYLSYYVGPKPVTTSGPAAIVLNSPTTPTAIRRHSTLPTNASQTPISSQRRKSITEDQDASPSTGGMQIYELPPSRIKSSSIEDVLKASLPELPPETHYEFLQRVRIAKALVTSPETRQKILGIRILALTNLAYVYTETTFATKILSADQDEPRRLQIVFQLAELIHSGDSKTVSKQDGRGEVPRWLQTLAFGALEAIAKHKAKTQDVCSALNVNVNHGVLLYVIRKMLAELGAGDPNSDDYDQEAEEWRDALFSLAHYLPNTAHAGQLINGAGLIPILCDFLQLRTKTALRYMSKVVVLMDALVYGVNSAFQALANARGLEVIVDLVADEVKSALADVTEGKGLPQGYRSEALDYLITHQRQMTLKSLWKFMQHMMGLSGGNTDRLLRNFIDSPKLLGAIKDVIENAPVFGTSIWSATVNILSSFIHNEPTSYAIIHEAGLSQALLRSVGGEIKEVKSELEARTRESAEDHMEATTEVGERSTSGETSEGKGKGREDEMRQRELKTRIHPPAQGILPSADALTTLPTAFGAICLNSGGMALFKSSGALERFFEIFESPEHVRCMSDSELGSVLGNQFDELVRHHPSLKDEVIDVVVAMCQRIVVLGKKFAVEKGAGAKLWMDDGKGGIIVAGGRRALTGSETVIGSSVGEASEAGMVLEEEDVEMIDADPLVPPPVASQEQEPDGTPKGEVVTLADVVDDDETDDPSKQAVNISTFIDTMSKFLEAFLQNASNSKDFIKKGGLNQLLAVYTLPSLPYDFGGRYACVSLARAFHIICDNNPNTALGEILEHAQKAVDKLEPLLQHAKKEGYFAPLTNKGSGADVPAGAPMVGDDLTAFDEDEEAERQAIENVKANGTKIVKALVTVHSFTVLIQDIFHNPLFNIRTVMPLFQSIPQRTEYETLIPKLGALHRICVWEEILLQKHIPPTWNEATKVKNGLNRIADAEDTNGASLNATDTGNAENERNAVSKITEGASKSPKDAEKEIVEREGKTSWFRNVKTIRFLLSQIPVSITPFLQGLAKALFTRRNPDMFHKQHAFKIAEAIASVMIKHLTWERLDTSASDTDKYGYWILMLYSIKELLYEDRPQVHVITTILINFKQLGGIKAIMEILNTFWHQVESLPVLTDDVALMSKEDHQKMAHAYGGIKSILSIIANITATKNVLDAPQTNHLASRERDREKPDYFNPSQFLVELRYAVLPTVQAMWEANFIDKASSSIIKSIIDILGIILKAEGEQNAFTRKDSGRQPSVLSWRSMEPNEEKLQQIMEMGFPRQDAQFALLRYNGDVARATEWLVSHRSTSTPHPAQESPASSRPRTAESSSNSEANTDVELAREEALARLSGESTETPGPATLSPDNGLDRGPPIVASLIPAIPTIQHNIPAPDDSSMVMSLDELPLRTPHAAENPSTINSSEPVTYQAGPDTKGKTKEDEKSKTEIVTVDDLNDLRKNIRDTLISRALDILQVHPDVTFELCSLINSAFGKPTESVETKKEIASTIVQSLMSLHLDDDFRPQAKTISATAHLLGLLIQSQDFYGACLEDLKSQVLILAGFIKIYPGEPAPWVPNILLVLEKILAEACQPRQVKFVANAGEQPGSPIAELTDYTISTEDMESIFEAVIKILPNIERDEILALSVSRILSILTRHRMLAVRMAESDNLQRLFHMLKRHAGLNTTRIQNCIMYILRHVIEDVDTIKSVMKAEIRNWFQQRGSRQDMNSYIRHTAFLVLRDPEAFVEVTNEICKLARYDPQMRNLAQQITLRESEESKPEVEEPESEHPTDARSSESERKDKDLVETETASKARSTVEMKPPGVAKPDGVIHFLLSELLHWKDIEDQKSSGTPTGADVEMKNNTSPSTATNEPESAKGGKPDKVEKPEKPEFKAEQHPIYLYRCFLLQALTELLSCYNRSKLEFINFSRKAQPREAIAPSKPRSTVLNYLLYDLIPQGSLLQSDDIASKKRYATSHWAISAVVALSSQTGESLADNETDLLFVRKFIVESMLKAYKDASYSNEALDIRYGRILSLADLFYRMLTARSGHGGGTSSTLMSEKSQQQIARIMFEKNVVGSLTNSLAEIDLNFPQSRRVVKYILKPLKVLSKTAVELGDLSDYTNNGAAEEDEISIATSLSEVDDMREETPDLYRNSALGMFEGGEMDEDEASDFEEDDGVIYEDEMDYDEEEDEGESGSVTTEDDVPEDAEMDVQIVLENHNEGTDEEDEEMSEDEEIDGDEAQAEVEIMDDMAGEGYEDENGADEEDWETSESEDEGPRAEEEEGRMLVQEPVDSILRALTGPVDEHEGEDDRDDGFIDDDGEEDDEDEEDDDELDEEEVIMHADDLDEEGDFASTAPWAWSDDPHDAPIMARGGQPARGGWYTLGGSRAEFVPNLRQIRPVGSHPRNNDEFAVNPLLQRSSSHHGQRQPTFRQELATNWVENESLGTSSAVTMLNTLMSFVARAHAHGSTAPVTHFRFTTHGPGALVQGVYPPDFPAREIRAMFGGRRPPVEQPRSHREDPQNVVSNFVPIITVGRWQEEMKLIYGALHTDKALKVVNAILNALVPPALEEEKIRKEREEKIKQEAKRLEEERQKKEEEERVAKEKAEEEERIKKEAEEREAVERAAAAEAAAVQAAVAASDAAADDSQQAEENLSGTGDAMEGVETTQAAAEEGTAGPSQTSQPRAIVMIRGREIDITGMEIDAEYLEALPEDLREEVLTNHIRERRAAGAASNEQPSEISREFLDALPDDIREELLAQEANERRRRERDAARARAAPSGAQPSGGVDIDLANFLATLDPSLRQTVLLEQDDESLAQLPQAIIAEANALRGDRRLHQFTEIPRIPRPRLEEPKAPKKPVRKTVVQLLDKAGVATLLRLMFMPQGDNTRRTLNDILLNVCENRPNRSEVLNTLLSILQEGCTDMAAVERTFGQLSLKAKQALVNKTPLKRTNMNTIPSLLQSSGEISPLMVAQQCLYALFWLVNYNEHIPSYFLNEHDITPGLKRVNSKKGKGKDISPPKSSKYALNTLLGLLDRPLITESTSVMEQLSNLLSEITRPLTVLKKEKKKTEEKPIQPPPSESEEPPASSALEEPPGGTTDVGNRPEESSAMDISGDGKEDDQPKKQRNLIPPVVPEYNLKLVVKAITGRECTSKTFRDILTTMHNLSSIPGARDVFGKELIEQAKQLGELIYTHLQDLAVQIQVAETGTELQGMALSKFSAASSDQAKLLRVLAALDYLFDPTRDKKAKPEETTEVESKPAQEEDKSEVEIFAKLYDSQTFSMLWGKLSECLSAIHEREDMLHVATILLPLIEALMIVCKRSGMKEGPRQREKTPRLQSPNAESKMEHLFFRFTEDHRKILNQMVRNNPKLMSGSFSLLVNNPKVLDFDNKRNYFNRRLHSRTHTTRDQIHPLQLNVRREHVFLDSFKSMYFKTANEIKYAKLNIRFSGEEGIDAGGVTREWFQVLARQMFNPDYALFTPVASDRTTFHPNRTSGVNPEHLSFFKFIGRIIGKALYEGRVLDCHFSRAVYKRILGKSVSIKDMETLDLDYYKSLVWMLENDITDIITETFSLEADDYGDKKIIDLVPNGRNVPVTEENKHEYVRLVVEYRLLTSVQEQMDHFLKGFHDIVQADLVAIFNEQELELLISGLPDIDVDDWRNNTEYHNYSASSPQIQWFWRAVRSFDKEERAKLLQFATGTSKVPLNGFKELEGMNGFSKFNIHRDYGSKDRLPSSHTCFNQIDLPEYDNYETLRHSLLTAITAGADHFGFA